VCSSDLDYAARLNERQDGMDQMSERFREMGAEVYVDAKKQN
jgi:phosphomethylpyrimidine synthase